MKQGHSFHRLFYHLVFSTKRRQHLIESPSDGEHLLGFFQIKAAKLDAHIEAFGCYRDHVHLLVRSAPSVSLSNLYGQLKGFCAYAWIRQFPDRPLGWQDGVWSATVDPDNQAGLREYIRDQWRRHDQKMLIDAWEPAPESLDPSPRP